jgi:hypothetical protein
MFARVKKSGLYEYLQIVQNRREGTKTIQRVVATIGRMDQIQEKGEIENLVRSLSRFSEKVLLILSGKSDIRADAKNHPPSSGGEEVRVRCRKGGISDGFASTLRIWFGSFL